MSSLRSVCLTAFAIALLACSPDTTPVRDASADAAIGQDVQSSSDSAIGEDAETSPDSASTMTFPAVCQESPLECPDMASLDRCEMGLVNNGCTYLPLTDCTRDASDFRLQGTCPSHAQVCRVTSGNQGFCTHSCIRDAQCPLPGGGTGTCTAAGPAMVCMRP